MKASRISWKIAVLGTLVAALLALAPVAAASGTGYDLSFSHAAGSSSNSAVDLIALSTNDPGGATISVSFTVSGTLNLADDNYAYDLFFGGGGTTEFNASAWVFFSNNSTVGDSYVTSSNGGGFGFVPYTLSNGGSTLSFAINKSAVGPSSAFSANVWAAAGVGTGQSSYTYSWLGSSYAGLSGNGGGGTCNENGTSCTSTAVSNAIAAWVYGAVATLIIVVVVVVIVVVLLMRKKRAPPQPPMMPPPAPMGSPTMVPPPPPPPQ